MKKNSIYLILALLSLPCVFSSCAHREWIEPVVSPIPSETAGKALNTTNSAMNPDDNTSSDESCRNGCGGDLPWKDGGVIQVIEIGVEFQRNAIKK
ncbi:MAG: hypothetical protein ACKVTZ_08170 [Bacteroidia bacterium]